MSDERVQIYDITLGTLHRLRRELIAGKTKKYGINDYENRLAAFDAWEPIFRAHPPNNLGTMPNPKDVLDEEIQK